MVSPVKRREFQHFSYILWSLRGVLSNKRVLANEYDYMIVAQKQSRAEYKSELRVIEAINNAIAYLFPNHREHLPIWGKRPNKNRGRKLIAKAKLLRKIGFAPMNPPKPLPSLALLIAAIPLTNHKSFKHVEKVKRRKQREADAEGTHTEAEWVALRESYNNKCLRCGSIERIVRDHIKPLYHGGSNYVTNLQPLCWKCNRWKGLRTIDYRPH